MCVDHALMTLKVTDRRQRLHWLQTEASSAADIARTANGTIINIGWMAVSEIKKLHRFMRIRSEASAFKTSIRQFTLAFKRTKGGGGMALHR